MNEKFSLLPNEILIDIFSFLHTSTIFKKINYVSKRVHELCNHDFFIRNLIKNGLTISEEELKKQLELQTSSPKDYLIRCYRDSFIHFEEKNLSPELIVHKNTARKLISHKRVNRDTDWYGACTTKEPIDLGMQAEMTFKFAKSPLFDGERCGAQNGIVGLFSLKKGTVPRALGYNSYSLGFYLYYGAIKYHSSNLVETDPKYTSAEYLRSQDYYLTLKVDLKEKNTKTFSVFYRKKLSDDEIEMCSCEIPEEIEMPLTFGISLYARNYCFEIISNYSSNFIES